MAQRWGVWVPCCHHCAQMKVRPPRRPRISVGSALWSAPELLMRRTTPQAWSCRPCPDGEMWEWGTDSFANDGRRLR